MYVVFVAVSVTTPAPWASISLKSNEIEIPIAEVENVALSEENVQLFIAKSSVQVPRIHDGGESVEEEKRPKSHPIKLVSAMSKINKSFFTP